MTVKSGPPDKQAASGGSPSPADIAREYLDLWDKNLALNARCGVVKQDLQQHDGDTADD